RAGHGARGTDVLQNGGGFRLPGERGFGGGPVLRGPPVQHASHGRLRIRLCGGVTFGALIQQGLLYCFFLQLRERGSGGLGGRHGNRRREYLGGTTPTGENLVLIFVSHEGSYRLLGGEGEVREHPVPAVARSTFHDVA